MRRRKLPNVASPVPNSRRLVGSGTGEAETSPITGPYGLPLSKLVKASVVLEPAAVNRNDSRT